MFYTIDGENVFASSGGVAHKKQQASLIFIHGAGMDHTIWVLFNRYFARAGFNTLAVDLPGHGKSSGQALASVEELASWLEKLINETGLQNTSLIGHSLGSLVAIETASKLTESISNLILLGTACPMPVGEVLLDAARENKPAAVDMIALFGHAYRSKLGGNPVAGLNIVNSSIRLLERSLNGRLFVDLNACNEYESGLKAAKKVTAKTTLILGSEDKMTPPLTAKPLLENLPNSNLVVLDNCGHMMLSEQPEQVHRALVEAVSS
ncbi:MAG: alpha/beta fold hydrolase [Gammaproteobacteria bacterium]|nr:alpha/beta fold hydrolase [Gammaproteobacteria bacterium]